MNVRKSPLRVSLALLAALPIAAASAGYREDAAELEAAERRLEDLQRQNQQEQENLRREEQRLEELRQQQERLENYLIRERGFERP